MVAVALLEPLRPACWNLKVFVNRSRQSIGSDSLRVAVRLACHRKLCTTSLKRSSMSRSLTCAGTYGPERSVRWKVSTMGQIENVVYTAKMRTTGGRENGAARSSDGSLDIRLSTPGSARFGTNPEQLFAAGWSAGLERAITQAARRRKLILPADLAIDAEVDLCRMDDGYFLRARLNVSLPGIERKVARALLDEAQQNCPYLKATRGSIDVAIKLMPPPNPSERT
jgi:lipoyl-dependent peroxiredoxin